MQPVAASLIRQQQYVASFHQGDCYVKVRNSTARFYHRQPIPNRGCQAPRIRCICSRQSRRLAQIPNTFEQAASLKHGLAVRKNTNAKGAYDLGGLQPGLQCQLIPIQIHLI